MGTRRLTWADLLAVVRYAPAGSALSRSIHGEFALWTAETHLLALLVDVLASANWQRGGGKGPRPKPIPRPKDKNLKRLTADDLRKDHMRSGVIGQAYPYDEMKAWLEAAANGRS